MEEEAVSQEKEAVIEAEEGKKTDSPLRASTRSQPNQDLASSSVKWILDFWTPEL